MVYIPEGASPTKTLIQLYHFGPADQTSYLMRALLILQPFTSRLCAYNLLPARGYQASFGSSRIVLSVGIRDYFWLFAPYLTRINDLGLVISMVMSTSYS
jgi:hypothetical protein